MNLLIDGYNLLHVFSKSPISSLEENRLKLLSSLNEYSGEKKIDITVVFDGSRENLGLSNRDKYGKVLVVYTSGDLSADDWIRLECERHPGDFVVVSSDNEVKSAAQVNRCVSLDSDEFVSRLKSAQNPAKDNPYFEDKFDSEEEDMPLYPKVSTRKKGVSKKLPRRERKKAHILKNL